MSYMFAATRVGTVGGFGGGSSVQHTKLLPMQEHSVSVQFMMTQLSSPYFPDLVSELETQSTCLT
jgi:hypothetical protein